MHLRGGSIYIDKVGPFLTGGGSFVNCPFVIMDFVYENFVDLIHYGIHFFGTELFSKAGKSLHIAEHHRDLLAFTFYLISLCQDLLG